MRSRTRRPRSVNLSLAVVVLAAACGTTADLGDRSAPGSLTGPGQLSGPATSAAGPSANPQAPAGQVAAGASRPAGSGPVVPTGGALTGSGLPADEGATAAPIEVGFFVFDNSQVAKALGLGSNTITTPTVEHDMALALIATINAAGGIAGHQLRPVFAGVSATSSDYQSDFQAACETLVKDHHVAAVVNDGLMYSALFNGCLAQAGVPQLVLSGASYSSGIGDTTEIAKDKGLIGVNTVTANGRIRSILNKALASGFLHSGSKLGVVVEGCPSDVRAYEHDLVPIAAQHKITLDRVDTDCATGFSEAGQQISVVQSAVLKFRSDGVDGVMFDSATEYNFYFYFNQQANSQKWVPQYLLFDPLGASPAASSSPSSVHGFGGWPLEDVARPPAPPSAQAAVRNTCLSIAKKHGVSAQGFQDRLTVFDMCDGLGLLRVVLTATQGRVGVQPVVAAIEGLGGRFVSALTLGGATRFGPGSHTGLQLTAVSTYRPACQCFSYITAPSPIS